MNPIDHYGEDKIRAERAIAESGLPYSILRLGGVISPDGAGNIDGDYLLLMRATPGDNRLHTVDARDVGLAFANAVSGFDAVAGKVLLIGGDQSHIHTHRDVEDDVMEAIGIGRLGRKASLPGDPLDDRGWGFTGWLDTSESQELLQYQRFDWPTTVRWVAGSQARLRVVFALIGPVLRPGVRAVLSIQRRLDHRGPYADPWTLIAKRYGPQVLARDTTA